MGQVDSCTNACLLPCDSGSCTNWLVKARSLDQCNQISNNMGCGDCKSSLDPTLSQYAQEYNASYATLCPSGIMCGRSCGSLLGPFGPCIPEGAGYYCGLDAPTPTPCCASLTCDLYRGRPGFHC